ncbi:MAG: hypothetical protein R3F55_24590 [Alphaproteobacteria bacterium]
MSRFVRALGPVLLAGAAAVLGSCNTGGQAPGGGGQSAGGGQFQPQNDRPVCRLYRTDGAACVTMEQLPMHPAQTDQGYATQLTWVLTNQCEYPMQVSWGWQPGTTVGQSVLVQGQSAEATCLWNYDPGCEGKMEFTYRCSQVP